MILDEFVKLTGYNRCYASYLLRIYEKRAVIYTKGKKDRLYTNFFLPSMRLIEKIRVGSKVTRGYNKPKTPCRRIIKSNKIPWKIKGKFTEQRNNLNPAELKRITSISCKKEIIQTYINITPYNNYYADGVLARNKKVGR